MVNIQCEMWETVEEIQFAESLEEYGVTECSGPQQRCRRKKNLPIGNLLSRSDLSSLFTE